MHRQIFPLSSLFAAVLAAAIGLACSSKEEGGAAGAGGSDGFAAEAAAACDRAAKDGCTNDPYCEEGLVTEHAVAKLFSCEDQHTAFVECSAKYAWICTSVGGGIQWETPKECNPQRDSYDACRPMCSYSMANETCGAACLFDGQKIGADCDKGPSACTCTDGPKSATSFEAKSCNKADLLAAMVASCK